jgi:murein DD-endopeptidase MepM/ murein hydrolase activator NlpD
VKQLSGETRVKTRLHPNRVFAIVAALSLVIIGGIVEAPAAWAVSYPSWADVQNARNSEAAKKAEISRLQGVLDSLAAAVTSTQAIADQKGNDLQIAQQRSDEAAVKAQSLKTQADAATAKAAESKQKAGQLAAQLARAGGSDLTATLFFDGSNASSLLSQLGLASKVADQSQGLYAKAVQDQNNAKSMTDQADVASAALKTLEEAAQKAMVEAQAAADAATQALADQTTHKAELDAQLASLTTNTSLTEAGYVAGVQAAAAAAAAAAALSPSKGIPGLGAGQISSSGWARPAGGHISSPYGYRVDPYNGDYALHAGTDLAAGCNTPIYAAHSGTIVYAGTYGGYGNYIRIANNDGTGVTTAYGHIVNGGILVSVGQDVGVGQNIARVGSTGMSTGCHLHFEVRTDGTPQDPVPFMRAHGVELAN